jgi:co-chaperonin GroES (HSP10)
VEVKNNSGWRPVGSGALLRAIELAEAQGKNGKIIVPEDAKMSSATCDTIGIVVALGDDVWAGKSQRAKVGDRVLFTKFTGGVIKGADGYIYRMIPADAIYAVKEEENG